MIGARKCPSGCLRARLVARLVFLLAATASGMARIDSDGAVVVSTDGTPFRVGGAAAVDPAEAEVLEERLTTTEAEIARITRELRARGVPVAKAKTPPSSVGRSSRRGSSRGEDGDRTEKEKGGRGRLGVEKKDEGGTKRRSSSSPPASSRRGDRSSDRAGGGRRGGSGRGRAPGGATTTTARTSSASKASRSSASTPRREERVTPSEVPAAVASDASTDRADGSGVVETAASEAQGGAGDAEGGWRPRSDTLSGFGKYLDLDGVALPRAFQDTYNAGTKYAGELADSASKSLADLHSSASTGLNDLYKTGIKYFNPEPIVIDEKGEAETGGGGVEAGVEGGETTGGGEREGELSGAFGGSENVATPPPKLRRREPVSGPACDPGCEAHQVCLDGACSCPVLYRGPNCSEPLTLEDDPPANRCLMGVRHPRFREAMDSKYGPSVPKAMRVPEIGLTRHIATAKKTSRDLPQMHMFDTCAVIGSSGTIKREKLGAEIDAHDAVFRFNEAPTAGYEEFVGNKTTLRIQNMDFCGAGERDGETCLAYTATRDKLCPRSVAAKAKGQKLNCKLVYPSHRDSKYIFWYWRMNSVPTVKDAACVANNGRCMNKMSAGYYGIMLALNLCGKVDLYGFGTTAKKETPHYFPKPSAKWDRTEWALRHHWGFERYCVGKFKAGVVPGLEVKI